MEITFRSILHIRDILGSSELKLSLSEPCTLETSLDALVDRFGPSLAHAIWGNNRQLQLMPVRVLVNGQDIAFLNGMDTQLNEGDQIVIIPPVAGG